MSIRIRMESEDVVNRLNSISTNLSGLDDLIRYNLEEGMKMAEGLAQVYAPVDRGLWEWNVFSG